MTSEHTSRYTNRKVQKWHRSSLLSCNTRAGLTDFVAEAAIFTEALAEASASLSRPTASTASPPCRCPELFDVRHLRALSFDILKRRDRAASIAIAITAPSPRQIDFGLDDTCSTVSLSLRHHRRSSRSPSQAPIEDDRHRIAPTWRATNQHVATDLSN